MLYVTIKRFRRDNAFGHFNIPYGTPIEERDGWLWYNGKAICGDHSAAMREYFARNDDGRGLERGALSQSIVKALEIRPREAREQHNQRWEVVWKDEVCLKYRKESQADFFLWSIKFFNAPIDDLKHIAALVGAGKGN